MQTKKPLMRLLAAIMTVAMMLTAIPFSTVAAADESTITDYVVVGTYNDSPVIWKVLEKMADGSLLLISKDVIANTKSGTSATKYYTTAKAPDYEGSNIEKIAKSILSLSEAETAALADVTMGYKAIVSGAVTTKQYKTKFAIPTVDDFNTYGLKAANLGSVATEYWLADARGNNATDKIAATVTANGAISTTKATNTAYGLRMVISIAGDKYIALPQVDGATLTVGNEAVKYAVIGTSVKLTLDESYSQSNVVVKFGGVEATGADNVYTVGAGEMTVEGIVANPGDFEAYNAAVAKAEALSKDNYSEESWSELETALAVDVSALTAAEQDKIDEATAAIEAAITNLQAAPADFTRYNAAVKAAKDLQNSTLHNLSIKPEGSILSVGNLIKDALKNEATILTYTKDRQAEVDAAAELLEGYCALAPYKNAALEKWTNAVKGARELDTTKYDPEYVANVQAQVEALVAENNYAERTDLDIRNQAEIDAAAAEISALYADKDSHFIQTDFSALEAALERAATYAEENYYKDEDVKREEEMGGTAAWTTFTEKLAAAQNYIDNKDKYTIAFSSQSYIDAATEQLVTAMDKLDSFVKLSKWDRFVKDVEWFFYDVKYQIDGIIALLKTVFGLLGMLFRGEIDLYGLFELLDVGEDVLNFLIKIGIKPKDYIDPGDAPSPAPEA